MIPEPWLGDRVRSLSVLCRKPKFPAKEGDAPQPHLTPFPLWDNCSFLTSILMFAPQKSPQSENSWNKENGAFSTRPSFSTPLIRDPWGAFQVLPARTSRLQAGTLQFSVCAREERPVCTGAHWEAPGKEENYSATHAGPVTPVWLTRRENSSPIRNLPEARKKQLLFALGWGTEGGQGSRAPRRYLLGALESSQGKAGDRSG